MNNVIRFKGLSEVGEFPSRDGRDVIYMTPEGKVNVGVIIRKENETFTVCNCENNRLEKINEESLWFVTKEKDDYDKVIDIIHEVTYVLDCVANYVIDHKVGCRVAIAVLHGKYKGSSIELANSILMYNYFNYGLSMRDIQLETLEIEYTICDVISSRLSDIIIKTSKKKKHA